MKKLVSSLLVIIISSNLLLAQEFLKLIPIENSYTLKKPISSIYQNKKEINVILRNSSYDFNANRSDGNKYALNNLFNIIEKEFIKHGLNVKDASLFKLDKQETNNDVDLMVDLSDVDWVEIKTNKYYDKKDKEHSSNDLGEIKFYGLKVDFRLVDVRNNEVVGFYTFGYTPCIEGCQIKIHKKGVGNVDFVDKRYEKYKGKYEINKDTDEKYEEFCKMVANSLITVLKKNTDIVSIFDESKELYEKSRKDVFKYFPVSYFFDNNDVSLVSKKKSIYVSSFNGENIDNEIRSVLLAKGFDVTDEISKAGYFLFYYKGKMLKRGIDPQCLQFQFIDAKTLKKLSGASYKYHKNEYEAGLGGYVELFLNSL